MSNWAIRWIASGELAGWPAPLVFASRKEALARRNKIAHQSLCSCDVVETELPVSAHEKVSRKKK